MNSGGVDRGESRRPAGLLSFKASLTGKPIHSIENKQLPLSVTKVPPSATKFRIFKAPSWVIPPTYIGGVDPSSLPSRMASED